MRKRNEEAFTEIKDRVESLGPAFLKLAQTLSTCSDLIGSELANELSTLDPFIHCANKAAIKASRVYVYYRES